MGPAVCVIISLFFLYNAGWSKPLIVAHLGASYDAPENTLPAFELAWKQGADAIEGDFLLTKDNRIVCIQDGIGGTKSGFSELDFEGTTRIGCFPSLAFISAPLNRSRVLFRLPSKP